MCPTADDVTKEPPVSGLIGKELQSMHHFQPVHYIAYGTIGKTHNIFVRNQVKSSLFNNLAAKVAEPPCKVQNTVYKTTIQYNIDLNTVVHKTVRVNIILSAIEKVKK